MRRFLTIWLASCLAVAATARGAADVVTLEETAQGIRVAWSFGPDGGGRARLSLPPGRDAAVTCVRTPDGRELPVAAVRVAARGWKGLAPFADLSPDPELVGTVAGVEFDITWVPARPAEPPLALLPAERLPSGATAPEPLVAWLTPAAARPEAPRDPPLGAPTRPPSPVTHQAGQGLRVASRLVASAGGSQRLDAPTSRTGAAFGQARVKITVRPDAPGSPGGPGLYRLTHSMLSGLGLDLSDVRLDDLRVVTLDARVSLLGRALVPLRRHDADANGLFGPGDWIELWGEPMVGEDHAGEFQRADFTDERAYVLDVAPAEPSPEIPADIDARPVSPPSPDFLATARAEVDDLFLNATRTGERGVDHFYWCSTTRLLWQAAVGTEGRRSETIDLPHLAAGSSRRGALRVRLLNRMPDVAASPDHRSIVDLNARPAISDVTGDGYQVVDHAAGGLVAGTDLLARNVVTVRVPGVPGAQQNLFELDWLEADYPRTFDADAGRLVFMHEPGFSVVARGLVGSDVTILDVTDPFAPRILTNAVVAAGTAAFEIVGDGAGTPVRSAVQETPPGEPTLRPGALELVADAGLRDASNACDVVVVGPRAWVDAARPGTRLADWRAAREARGVAVKLVATEDAIDTFTFGTFSPVAVAGLLAEAFASWTRPPRFVLLLGDTSLDYKNLTGGHVLDPSTCADVGDPCGLDETEWVQHVPTRIVDMPADTQFLGWYASDVLLSLVAGGDWEPDVVIGRLPARSADDVDALLAKVLAYEGAASARPAWGSRALLVADQIEVPIEQAFESYQEAVRDAVLLPRWDVGELFYQRDFGGTPPEPFTRALLDTWRDGARAGAVLSYVGHGAAYRWSSDDIMLNRGQGPCRDDVADLSGSGVPEIFVLNANCITGTFVYPLGPSLLEELVRAPQGGAIAAFGPTGVTELGEAQDVLNAAYGAIHGPDGRTRSVADAIAAVQGSLAVGAIVDPLPLLANGFLGDPTLQLAVNVGPPAISLAASPGDALVDLSWPAVPGAASYALWRSDAGVGGPYEIIADGLTGTTHRDAGDPPGPAPAVVNNQLYHYALEPLAADGGPGRWSARVPVRPCTMAAPEAAGTLTVNPGPCTGSFSLRWGASPTAGLQGYRVRAYRGTVVAGAPVRTVTVPGVITSLTGLVPWQDYTFTVSAVTWCNVEGPASVPVTARSTCPLALDPPAFVTDLRVRRQGGDIALSWSPVTRTIQGTPATIVSYRVHRSSDAAFFAGVATTIQDAGLTAMVDPARVGSGTALELYAVAAVDDAGRSGGVAHDMPQGARGLLRTDLGGGEWELTWTPVRYDIRGEVSPIVAYDVYASDTPISRARIEAEGLVPVATVPGPPARVTAPVGATSFFIVPEDVHGNRSAD